MSCLVHHVGQPLALDRNLLFRFSLGWLSTSANRGTLHGKLSGNLEGPKYEAERLSGGRADGGFDLKNLERKAPPTKGFLSKREPKEILEGGRELPLVYQERTKLARSDDA